MDVSQLRREYDQGEWSIKDLARDPLRQFEDWFQQACDTTMPEPNAMVLATADEHGPTQRTVLLKYFDQRGFVFFTNYESRKAQHIGNDANVCLLFPWYRLQRQVEINGRAERISTGESLKYFSTRPRGAQLGAWASPQSNVVTTAGLVQAKIDEMKRKFGKGEIPLPSFWGGIRIIPHRFEFWQGRPSRLHDRFQYSLQEDDSWLIEQLAP